MAKSRQQKNIKKQLKPRWKRPHFRLPPTAPLHCLVLPICSLSAPPCSLIAPSVLPLKRPCSLSRPGRATSDPKFGVYIIYIYIYYIHPELRIGDCPSGMGKEQGRFRGSSEGAKRRSKGAPREHRGSIGAQQEERFWLFGEPNLAAPYSVITAPVIHPAVLPGSACCCLDSYSFAGS